MKNKNLGYKKSFIDKSGKCVEIALLIFLIIYCISLMLPLIWMIISSFKTYDDYILNMFKWPAKFRFENYKEVFEVFRVPFQDKDGSLVYYDMAGMAFYSIIYTFCRAGIHVILGSMCAYVLAKFKFFGRNFIYSLGIVIMIIPIIGATPALMLLRKDLGIYNNMTALILTAESTAFSGIHFLLLFASFKRIPTTYSEAVFIDGGTNFTAFFRIALPMALPSMVAVFVLQFLATWTDYNVFVIWLPSYPSLSVGMYFFERLATKKGITMPVVLASFVIVIIPTSLLYLATQNVLMSKFTVGGLKG